MLVRARREPRQRQAGSGADARWVRSVDGEVAEERIPARDLASPPPPDDPDPVSELRAVRRLRERHRA